MKSKLKLLALTLSSIMVLSTFSGCGINQENLGFEVSTKDELDPEKIGYYSTLKLPIDKKGTTITAIADTNVTTNNESIAIQELRKRTGINVQILAIPRATITEKAKVLLASKNDMPDLFAGGFNRDELNDFGMQGAFEPITKHIDELPNFKEIFYDKAEENNTVDKLKPMLAPDGNLYTFPSFNINRHVNHGMLYRKDIFDKHNIKMWNSKEEFYEVLKKLKELYPNSDPMVSKTGTVIFRDLGYSWGLEGFDPYYDEQTKLWKLSTTDPKFKEMIDYLKKLYDENLLDPEFLTSTQAAWTTKMTQADKAFVTWDWIGRLDMFYEQASPTVPGYDLRYGNPLGGKVVTLSQVGSGPAVKKGPNSLLAMKLCDYLISPSGAQLMTMGVEGVTYEMDENGFAKYYGFEEGQAVGIDALEEKYGLFISSVCRRFDKRSTYFNYTEKEKEAQDLMLNKPDGFLPEDPEPTFTAEEKEILAQHRTALVKAAQEFVTKYILSSATGDSAWNAWLKKAEELGESRLMEVYNQAQKRYDEL